jgi:ABC-type branched-subunit amino acid transport system substrate-binding protein
MSKHFRIGVMLSTTGPYGAVGQSMLSGALLAFREFAASHSDIVLEPVVVNPGGDLVRYGELSKHLLEDGIRHVIGCYTSSSRKEVIPRFEKHDSLLWYPTHYEGFESSNNVIYTGATPNQHVLPLVEYLSKCVGDRAFFVGSNYIWAWENNRIFRDALAGRNGSVLGERYFALGDTELQQVIDMILKARPSYVFNTLIGPSAYEFFRLFRANCIARGIDQPNEIPVASCSLSEPELLEIGEAAVDGHLSSSVYFSSLENSVNVDFVARYRAAFPFAPPTSAESEGSYVAAKLLALTIAECGSGDVPAVKAAVSHQRIVAPQGDIWIDPLTAHAFLTPRIGRSNVGAQFDIVMEAAAPVGPDPYLVHSSSGFAVSHSKPRLRLVR